MGPSRSPKGIFFWHFSTTTGGQKLGRGTLTPGWRKNSRTRMRTPITVSISSSVKLRSSRGFRPRQGAGRNRQWTGWSRNPPPSPPPPPPRNMISWHTHYLWIFKVSGLNCFFLLNLCLYPSRSYSWNPKKKIHGWSLKVCGSHGQHIPVSRGFPKEHEGMGGVFVEVFFIKCPHHRWSLWRNCYKQTTINKHKHFFEMCCDLCVWI